MEEQDHTIHCVGSVLAVKGTLRRSRGKQSEPVADTEVVFGIGEERLGLCRVPRDGELGPTDLLAAEQVADGFNRLELEVEVGFEVQFHSELTGIGTTEHRYASSKRSPLGSGIGSPNSLAVSIQSSIA